MPHHFQQITFKLGSFTHLKSLFSVLLTYFPELVHVKIEKTVKRSIVEVYLQSNIGNLFLRGV